MEQGRDHRSLPSLFAHLVRELADLVRQEIALARAEIAEAASQAGIGIGALAAGGTVILIGLFFLTQALVFGVAGLLQLWISEVTAAWLAPLLVGLIAVVIGWLVLSRGLRRLKARNLAPRRTLGSLRRDQELVKEHVR